MLRLKNLKAGDLIQVNHNENGWAIVKIGTFKTIISCDINNPKCLPDKTIMTYIGKDKIPNIKSKKRFFGCYCDDEILYISGYILKIFFTKIKKGKP